MPVEARSDLLGAAALELDGISPFPDEALAPAAEIVAETDSDMQVLVCQYAETVFRQLDCKGIVRVDFILDEKAGIPYFLEVNTIPGQTAMSIIPAQLKSQGLDVKQFYTKLVEEGLK